MKSFFDDKSAIHIATDMSSEWYGALAVALGSNHRFFHIVKRGDQRRTSSSVISTIEGNRIISVLQLLKDAWRDGSLVVFHSAYPYLFLAPAIWFLNIDVRFIVRSSDYLVSKRNLYTHFLVKRAFDADNFVFKSRSAEVTFKLDYDLPDGASSKIYLFNPIRSDFYETASRWHRLHSAPVRIFIPAQISRSKNIHAVVQFGNVLASDFGKPVTIDIVGELVDMSYLQSLMDLAGRDVEIQYCNRRLGARQMVARYLSSSVVFQLAKHETLGICFVEAALLGVPCVAIKGAGIHGTPPFDRFISFAESDAFEDLLDAWRKSRGLIDSMLARELLPTGSELAKLWESGLKC